MIVGLGRREAHVARAQQHRAVRQAEAHQHLLGVPRQRLELVVGPLGRRELDELDLVELVLPDQAAHVGAVRSRLAAEARRVGGVTQRQLAAVEDLVAMQVGQRHLGRRHQIQVPVAGDLEEVRLELRQVPRAGQRRSRSPGTAARPPCSRARACAASSMKLISARSSRAPAPISTANRAPDILVARSKSMMPSAGPRSQCGFGAKSKARGSPCRRTSTLSAALAPTGTDSCGRLGSVRSRRRRCCSICSSFDLDLLDPLAALAARRVDRGHVLPLAPGARHLVAGGILLALQILHRRNRAAPAGFELAQFLEFGVRVHPAVRERRAHVFHVIANKRRVEHVELL